MGTQPFFEDVSIGDTIPTVTEVVTTVQMFFFSAATHNGHRIHYDAPYATEVEGHPDLLVQGPLQVALLARTLTDWAGPLGRLVRLKVQNRASAYPGNELQFSGTVCAKREDDGFGFVDIDIHEENEDGVLLMPATATLRLPMGAR